MNLTNLACYQKAIIKEVLLDKEENERLFYHGIFPGAYIQKIREAPLHDPILYLVNGNQLVLRQESAKYIQVEVII